MTTVTLHSPSHRLRSRWLLILTALLTVSLILVIVVQNGTLQFANRQPVSLGPLPGSVLTHDALLPHIEKLLDSNGLSTAELAAPLDLSQGIFTSYDNWIKATSGEPGEALVTAGVTQRPVFAISLALQSDNAKQPVLAGLAPLQGIDSRLKSTYSTLIVAVFADNGDPVSTLAVPVDKTPPDYSQVPQYTK